jgi:hypothetical protein
MNAGPAIVSGRFSYARLLTEADWRVGHNAAK